MSDNSAVAPEQPNLWVVFSYVVVGVVASSIAYYLDGARLAAFVLVPWVSLSLILRELGISLKSRPRVAITVYLAFLLYSMVVTWLVINAATASV